MTRFTRWLRRVLLLPCRHEWGEAIPVVELWEIWNNATNGTDHIEIGAVARTCQWCGSRQRTYEVVK